jgi:hypothetical protein
VIRCSSVHLHLQRLGRSGQTKKERRIKEGRLTYEKDEQKEETK